MMLYGGDLSDFLVKDPAARAAARAGRGHDALRRSPVGAVERAAAAPRSGQRRSAR